MGPSPPPREPIVRIPRAPAAVPEIPIQSYGMPLSYYSVRGDLTTTLTLNNKGNNVLTPRVTLYARDGRRKAFTHFAIPPRSFEHIDIRELVNQSGEGFEDGSVNVFYTGIPMEMGGLLRMTNAAAGLEWDEQLMYPAPVRSTTLHGVGWLPNAQASGRLVVTNATGDTVNASITIDRPGRPRNHDVVLGPWQMEVLDLGPNDLRPVTGQPHPGAKLVAIAITHDGRPGGVVARGLVSDVRRRYSGVITFTDPAQATTSTLHAGGVRVAPFSEEPATPWLAATNRGAAAVTLSGRLWVTTATNDVVSVPLPDTTLQPSETVMIDARRAWTSAARVTTGTATLEMEYDGSPGTVIVSAATTSRDLRHSLRLPLYEAATMPSAAGDYFWQLHASRSTLVSITNTTSTAQWFKYVLRHADGAWTPKIQRLRPHETTTIDVAEIQRAQVRDSAGRTLPASIDRGQLHWSQMGGQRRSLIGRVEQIDLVNDLSSTFACPPASEDIFYAARILPFFQQVLSGQDVNFVVEEQDRDGLTNDLTEWFDITAMLTWDSGDTAVATPGQWPGQFWGGEGGDTWVYAYGESAGFLYWNGEGEEPEGHDWIDEYADVQTVPAYPVNIRIYPDNQPPDAVHNGSSSGSPYRRMTYVFESSSGTLAHLGQCAVFEYVQYNPSTWPSPPFQGTPTPQMPALMANGPAGYFIDSHTTAGPMLKDGQGQAVAGTVTGTQKFQWKCLNIQNGSYQDFTSGANKGPHDIVRNVTTGSGWSFSITKHGVPASCPLSTSTGFCQ